MAKKSIQNRPRADLVNGGSAAVAKADEYPRLRTARAEDLEAINRVIESAIATWDLPQRVKRISLPLYRYQEQDLAQLHIEVLETAENDIAAVVSWENECREDMPPGHPALLLHGVYVSAERRRKGLGSRLLQAAEQAAARNGCGVLVKAQAGAGVFFLRRGYRKLAIEDPDKDYPHRYWKPFTQA